MMDKMAASINDSITEFLAKDENKNVFKNISFNKDYSELNVKVDAEHYAPLNEISLIGLQLFGSIYQTFNGTEKKAVKTNIINYSNGTVIKTSTSPEN
ncbi:hypothetical protein [Candidatus Desulfosporosinus nitrosoreducens]|uniref:hypothetical protein n=1 Tax=Candidatus Desulfosporosinus nitrosoreducens TaxID=3401928 RepID=UPI00280BB37E|nr:hypothetical protein [Desulfosporosinus sp. PR]